MRPAINIEGLAKTYAASGKSEPKHALKAIDLEVPVGSMFALLGPNGAGKSTLINILGGLVNKSAGKVDVWGFDMDVNPAIAAPNLVLFLRNWPWTLSSHHAKPWRSKRACMAFQSQNAEPWKYLRPLAWMIKQTLTHVLYQVA